MWDAEGQRYIDYIGSWGPMILGHGHPAVLEAVQQRGRATACRFGAPTEREIELAEAIIALVPSVEQVRLVSSGTEAAMSAIRLARGATGRSQDRQVRGLLPRPCRRAAGQGRLRAWPPSATRPAPACRPRWCSTRWCSSTTTSTQLEAAFALHGARHRLRDDRADRRQHELRARQRALHEAAARAVHASTARCWSSTR